jgi:cytochrome c-type biogenesis protein CcsB
LTFGFPLMTMGIISGAIWANSAWGGYWRWDPKETWALITWFLYAALLHGRLTIGWRGRRAAIFAIIGFLCLLFTFLGVNLLLSGEHSFRALGGR